VSRQSQIASFTHIKVRDRISVCKKFEKFIFGNINNQRQIFGAINESGEMLKRWAYLKINFQKLPRHVNHWLGHKRELGQNEADTPYIVQVQYIV
jgi:hypothetical protein